MAVDESAKEVSLRAAALALSLAETSSESLAEDITLTLQNDAVDALRSTFLLSSLTPDVLRASVVHGFVEYLACAIAESASSEKGKYIVDARAIYATKAACLWTAKHLEGAHDIDFQKDILQADLPKRLIVQNERAAESDRGSSDETASGRLDSDSHATPETAVEPATTTKSTWARRAAIGMSALVGGVALAATGGLAAPAIAAGFASASAAAGAGAVGAAVTTAATTGGGALAVGVAGGVGAAAAAHSTAERLAELEGVKVLELPMPPTANGETDEHPAVLTELCFPGWIPAPATEEDNEEGGEEEEEEEKKKKKEKDEDADVARRICQPFADAGFPSSGTCRAIVGTFTGMADLLASLKTIERTAVEGAATAAGVRGLQMTVAGAMAVAAAPAMIAYGAVTAHGGAFATAMSQLNELGANLAERHVQTYLRRLVDDDDSLRAAFRRPVALVGVGVGSCAAVGYAERVRALAKEHGFSSQKIVGSIWLVGAPIGHSRSRAQSLAKSCASGMVCSAFSTHDYTMKVLPRCNVTAEGLALGGVAGASASGYKRDGNGRRFWHDVDCSDIVGAHEDWRDHLPEVLSRMRAAELDAMRCIGEAAVDG